MKTFEEFKNEVNELVDIYNQQDHWVDGEVGRLKVTIKPIFGDFSNDGYMPKYCSNFVIYYGSENPCKTNRFFTFDLMINKYVSGFISSKDRTTRKNARNAFKGIFDI